MSAAVPSAWERRIHPAERDHGDFRMEAALAFAAQAIPPAPLTIGVQDHDPAPHNKTYWGVV